MRIYQHISSVAVVLCVADRVAGHITPVSQRSWESVAAIDEDEQIAAPASTAMTTVLDDNKFAGSAAWDASRTYVLDSQNHDEDDSTSTLESVLTASIPEPDTTSHAATISARQDGADPVSTRDPSALPIEPKITPAIGIAGAIMLGTGVALCLVGIKKQWLHVFLSTACLASLAVTVLIIYVMNPEHSDAIQGAYVVAAVVTGLIFGAVSLIFQEVTEGLGCMLGSFCFAMWILVLAPGGIIHSTAGRGILIGVITVAGFGLSFSHHTRMYALLCCTSFAGATTTVLGVDCFSRAGLKEFWLYLWSLNDKQFPLDTNTYPITRGIRVEIACIIVVFLLGLVSQFKLWKVIEARRAKNEEDRQRVEDERLEAEAAIGRDLEANTERERVEWEAAYGEKHISRVHTDSGVGSSVETFGKDQFSVREREVDAIELSDIEERQSGRGSDAEHESSLDDCRASGHSPKGTMERIERSGRGSQDSSRTRSDDSLLDETIEGDGDSHAYAVGAPDVVPLPFRVPTEEQAQGNESEANSATHENVDDTAPVQGPALPLQKLSLQKLNEHYASDAPKRDIDQASSVAATADDIAVLDGLSSGQQSNRQSMVIQPSADDNRLAPPLADHNRSRPISMASELSMVEVVEEDDDEALQRDPVTIDKTTMPVISYPSKEASRRLSDASRTSKPPASYVGHSGSVPENLVEQLPPKLSKIALTYRTNEWAKHIANADHPGNGDELERPSSPGVQVDTSFPEEAAKPVDVEALQQTNFANQPVLPSHTTSKASKESRRTSRQSEPGNNHSRVTSTQSATPIYSFGRSSSQMSLNRHNSTSASPAKIKIGSVKKTTMPLTNQTLLESPAEDATETSQHHGLPPNTESSNNPSAITGASNLLDERNAILQRRQTTTSFNGLRSTPSTNLLSAAISEDQVHQPYSEDQPARGFVSLTQSSPALPAYLPPSGENMTLSQRRSLMQQQQTSTASPAQTMPTQKPRPSIYSTLAYDSHQPARQPSTNSIQQSARLNQWRQTLQADVQAKAPPRVVESTARQNMIDGRRQSELWAARKKEEESKRQSAIDEAMRRGQLDGAHRDAMRRMQARATRDGT
jgi:hypothetical protein